MLSSRHGDCAGKVLFNPIWARLKPLVLGGPWGEEPFVMWVLPAAQSQSGRCQGRDDRHPDVCPGAGAHRSGGVPSGLISQLIVQLAEKQRAQSPPPLPSAISQPGPSQKNQEAASPRPAPLLSLHQDPLPGALSRNGRTGQVSTNHAAGTVCRVRGCGQRGQLWAPACKGAGRTAQGRLKGEMCRLLRARAVLWGQLGVAQR